MQPFSKRLLVLLAINTLILLIPLVAMQFTNEVNWGWGDFMVAAFLLLSAALLIELFIRRIGNKTYRLILIALVLLGLLLLWVELAVGIFGSRIAGN